MVSEEPFNKTPEQYFKEAGKPYELEQFDRNSLEEIRKLIKAGKYNDAHQLRDHMEFVENLIERLTRILDDEAKEEIVNLSLKHDIASARRLYDEMASLLDMLEGV